MISKSNAASIRDLRLIAKRRLPRFAFDFIDGGAEDEINLRKNRTAFEGIELLPQYMTGVSDPATEIILFGKRYSAPIGIAPMGFLNMSWPGADLAAAKLAAQQNIPYVISTPSSTRLETLAETANGNAWFQVFPSKGGDVVDDLLERAKSAGIDTLVVTVDVAQPGKRDRDVRNRLKIPFRLTPAIITDLILHARWSMETIMAGPPKLANFETSEKTAGSSSLAESQKLVISRGTVWDDLKRLRDNWQGSVVVKGILHPDDVNRSIEAGCDAIVVSNHGGRQVDYGPASIDALPTIVSTTAGRVPIILDSGVRRGADVVRAKALGASMVFAGRAFAYGIAAAGDAGAQLSFDILMGELRAALSQLGVHDYNLADERLLMNRYGS